MQVSLPATEFPNWVISATIHFRDWNKRVQVCLTCENPDWVDLTGRPLAMFHLSSRELPSLGEAVEDALSAAQILAQLALAEINTRIEERRAAGLPDFLSPPGLRPATAPPDITSLLQELGL